MSADTSPALRPSHFAPVRDVLRISRRVGRTIVGGGLMLGNLRRMSQHPVVIAEHPHDRSEALVAEHGGSIGVDSTVIVRHIAHEDRRAINGFEDDVAYISKAG